MTNVEVLARPANNAERKKMFDYLTAHLPTRFGYARRVAKSLNDRHQTSVMGQIYTTNIVYQVVDKGAEDIHVERELVALNEEYFGKPISQICPDYVPPLF